MGFIHQLNTAHSSGKAFAAAVITAAEGTTPRHPGTKMIIYEDGTLAGTIGGGEIEHSVIRDAYACLSSREPLLKTYPVIQSDGIQSGSETIYIEPSFPPAHLILCGAGHVAGKLIAPAKSVGFRVTVIDIRDEAMIRERAAAADEFILASGWAEGLARIPANENQYLIACAFNFEQDEEILYHIVRRISAHRCGNSGGDRPFHRGRTGKNKKFVAVQELFHEKIYAHSSYCRHSLSEHRRGLR